MDLDYLRMEYVVDTQYSRGAPVEAEKALHALFLFGTSFDGEYLIPQYVVRVYINDRLCWNDYCDFYELAQILQKKEGIFTPFTYKCEFWEELTPLDRIESFNNGKLIVWRTKFPSQLPMGCCWQSHQCSNCDANFDHCKVAQPNTWKEYHFSAGQVAKEVIALANAVNEIDLLWENILGGSLPLEKQEELVDQYAEKWAEFSDFDRVDWNEYLYRRCTVKELLQMNFSHLVNHFSYNKLPPAVPKPETPPMPTPVAQKPETPPIPPPVYLVFDANDTIPENCAIRREAAFPALFKAMKQHRVVNLTYVDAEGNTTERAIEPEILAQSGEHCYCVAYCNLREEARMFRMDRIQKCTRTKHTFQAGGIAEKIKEDGLFAL